MIQRLVITINMGRNIVGRLSKMPEAGANMVNRIISEIDSNKKIKLTRHQVLVVLGRLNEYNCDDPTLTLRDWLISWNYSYITSGERPKVTIAMDEAVCSIIKMATRGML